jgi:hypothetical protein
MMILLGGRIAGGWTAAMLMRIAASREHRQLELRGLASILIRVTAKRVTAAPPPTLVQTVDPQSPVRIAGISIKEHAGEATLADIDTVSRTHPSQSGLRICHQITVLLGEKAAGQGMTIIMDKRLSLLIGQTVIRMFLLRLPTIILMNGPPRRFLSTSL